MVLTAGDRLGPYEIIAPLGEGGMGEVYRATDTRLKRDVAIKVLPAKFTADRERLARFEREAQLLAQLNHQNIAAIHGLEESDGTRALVMELVEGETLAERLAGGALSFNESVSVALQLARALEEAHGKGIIHRDLKPQNIKASTDGRVKVLDFGLAKAMEAAPGPANATNPADSPTLTFDGTHMGVILGTAAYMAPEQARGGVVDKRADIWAFGVLLYEMLTGDRLFAEGNVVDTLSAVMRKEIDLDRLPASIPPRVRELVRRCLDRNPKNRLPDIAEARVVLEEIERGTPGTAPAITKAQARSMRPSRQVGAAGVGVLAIMAAAYFVVTRDGRGDSISGTQTAASAASAPSGAADRSIAVLPLANLSAEAENAFFAAGVHEDVLTYLSRVADLRVISRSSVLQYANPEGGSVKKIAAELGVAYIVEGSVRRAGNRVRVSAQLIDARSDAQMWADSFDRDLADVFAIQSAIAKEIVAALKANLSPREAELLSSRPTSSIEAYDLFVKARGLIERQALTADNDEPIRLLKRAVELDPEFAQAHALLATTHGDLYWFNQDRSPERLALMKAAVDRALALKPDLPESRLALADYYYRGFYDYARALEQLELARQVMPNDSLIQFHLGLTYRRLGEMDRSIDAFEAAARNDPTNLRAYCEAVNTATASMRFERARLLAEAAERRFPGNSQVAGVRAQLALDSRGDVQGAVAILDAAGVGPDNLLENTWFLTALAARRFREAAAVARRPNAFDVIAPGWGATQAALALSLGRLDADAKRALEEGAKILKAEVAKPYARTYAWPHLAYAINLTLQGRGAEAVASCERAMQILPWEKDKVHGATLRAECAWVQAKAGRVDDALNALEANFQHPWAMSRWYLSLDPRWDFLRANPRLRELSKPEGQPQ